MIQEPADQNKFNRILELTNEFNPGNNSRGTQGTKSAPWIDININKIKLIIPQKTDPNKIKESVSIKLPLSILLKKNGVCKVWSIRHKKHKTIKPVKKPLL